MLKVRDCLPNEKKGEKSGGDAESRHRERILPKEKRNGDAGRDGNTEDGTEQEGMERQTDEMIRYEIQKPPSPSNIRKH